MAKYAGYSEQEQKWASIFWEATFNKSWLYLTDEMIVEWMGYILSKTSISDFHRKMKEDYRENIDYKEVDKNHDLVKFWINSHPDLNRDGKRVGNRKKYYIITGEALKKTLMRARTKQGDLICDYFIKTESLASLMKDYMVEQSKLLIKEKDEQLQTKDDKLNRLHIQNKELLSYKKLMTKDESIYIISTLEYSRQGHFRPGRTKQMTGRLSTHNSSHTSGDMMVVLKEYKVNNAVLVEGIIRKKLAGLLVEKDKEFVMCPFNLLDEIIQLIVENDGQESDLVNKIIDIVFNLKQHTLNSANWMTGIDESIFHQGQMQLIENGTEQIAVFDVANATDAQKQEFVRQCIEVYKITIIQPQLLQVQTTIQIIWKSFQGLLFQQSGLPKSQFKVADWKPAVKTVETEEETLTIKWRGN